MMEKCGIPSAMLYAGVIHMKEQRHVVLANLPTSIRGYVYLDSNGDPVIVLNSRLTREQNRRTFRHEENHIKREELTDPTYNEYEGE